MNSRLILLAKSESSSLLAEQLAENVFAGCSVHVASFRTRLSVGGHVPVDICTAETHGATIPG
jgi:hypothetical protein